MPHRLVFLAVVLFAWPLALFAKSPAANSVGPDASAQELRDALIAHDRALFAALFDDRDATRLRELVSDDLEFYHDKWGLMTQSGDKWVEGVRAMFKRQDEGTDFRGRRELDLATVQIHPLKNYGVMMMGTHRFWNRGTGQRTEIARFVNLWKFENGRWRLARVISYDHVPWKD